MNKKRDQILSQEALRGQRIPLLHKDRDWIELFGDSEDKDVVENRNILIKLEQKELSYNKLLRELSKEKNKYMRMILKVSDTINNENKKENIKFLDEYKEKLLLINDKMDEINYQLETLPDEIRQANLNLLNATIKLGYGELDVREDELKKALIELDAVNKRLSELVEIKVNNEEWIDHTYTFMHRLLGNDIIEKIDRILSR